MNELLVDQAEAEISSRKATRITGTLANGAPFEREMTAIEQAMEAALDEILREDTHGVWHRFQAEVLEAGDDNNALSELAEAFAERHPGWVELASCDNDRFMSSDLVLVRHGSGDHYMGLSLVYLSQGEAEPVELFLYPGHADSLLRGIRALSPSLAQAALSFNAPTNPESLTDEIVRYFERKPSSFDFFRNRWRDKPWYAETGHAERLEAIANAQERPVSAGAAEVSREAAEGACRGVGAHGGVL